MASPPSAKRLCLPDGQTQPGGNEADLAAIDDALVVLAAARDRLAPPSSYLAKTTRGVAVLWSANAGAVAAALAAQRGDFSDAFVAMAPGDLLEESLSASVDAQLRLVSSTGAGPSSARPVAFVDLTKGEGAAQLASPALAALLVRVATAFPLCAVLLPVVAAEAADSPLGQALAAAGPRFAIEWQPVTAAWTLLVAIAADILASAADVQTVAVRAARPPDVPDVASRRQFSYARRDPDLWARVTKAVAGRLFGCPLAVRRLVAVLADSVDGGADDVAVYAQLHAVFHGEVVPSAEYQRAFPDKAAGRAWSRTQEITDLLPPAATAAALAARGLLDYGCAEGSITAALGRAYGLAPDTVHGCDVREPAAREGFTFRLVDGRTLPYAAGSFGVATALMALHHVADVPAVLAELARVLAPGGFLVLREHDCAFPALAVSLDLVHGLYSLVWSAPPEWPAFVTEYYAHYRPRAEWTALCAAAGLTRVTGDGPAGFPHVASLYDLCTTNNAPSTAAREASPRVGDAPARGDRRAGTPYHRGRSENNNFRDQTRRTERAPPAGQHPNRNPQRFWYGLYKKAL
jgi:SAM-dependent methyltransferase